MIRHSPEATFAAALINPDAALPEGVVGKDGRPDRRRFAVYRNNVIVSLTDALHARFPVTHDLVGSEFFRAMAQVYVRQSPPQSRLMFEYGATFPEFIAGFEPAFSVPYLADVARLEALRTEAYHAADVVPVEPDAFSAILSQDIACITLDLHPSLRLLRSRYAVASIWAAHQGLVDLASVDVEDAEDVLIARPHLEVETRRLSPGAFVLFERLQQGEILGGAVLAAANAALDFDLTATLGVMLQSRVVVRIGQAI
ncbi:MAG: putative DNA-binding domain-containing protein [Proteobacteria bacterium]|nr:putative DNA-binding domain-containing protein [Pseudomonadota bacterium]